MRTLYDILKGSINKTQGEYGVEIEVEGEDLPSNFNSDHWRVDTDSSLRGESYEYVTPYPVDINGIRERLDILKKAYRENDSVVYNSVRAGVHVHMNAQTFTINQLFTFITSYYLLEEVLVSWCGPDREGNHFCLRHFDAEAIIFTLYKVLTDKNLKFLNSDDFRYSSLNLISLFKYGSVEFRAMRSTDNFDDIYAWVKILDELKRTSFSFNNPRELILSMSAGGELGFLKLMLPTFYPLFENHPNLNKSIRKACRNVQSIAFDFDWDDMNSSNNNPFNKKVW